LLRAVDVGFAYRRAPVLHGVSIEVARGTIVGVLGPNGSGKTTIMRLLSGVLSPTSGRVFLGNHDLRALPRRTVARRIAVVPQDTHLTFDYRVLDIALMGRHPYLGPFEIEGPDDLAAARRALAATGTADLEARSFQTLSGGERQRVIIASALAQFEDGGRVRATPSANRREIAAAGELAGAVEDGNQPRALLLDEPTASLDLRYQIEVAALLKRLNRDVGLTIVVSTHDLNFAAGLCDSLVLLREGRVLAAGPTADVLTRESVRALYAVDADVQFHRTAGHLTVVPLGEALSARHHPDA
jgi:iron complex transport system ATP-binding protein